MFLGPWGLKLKAKGHIIIKEQQLIMAACKGMARGDAPGELKLKLTKMVTAMPLKV
jgi:chemotaxis protein MotA